MSPAATLQPGDKIRQANGSTGEVETVRVIVRPQEMYNFTVAAAHTYFVGEGQWLVHNSCIETLYKASQVADRNGLTLAGRALQKHSNRPASLWAPYLPSSKTANSYNQEAATLVMDILTDPLTTHRTRNTTAFGVVNEYFAPDGRGLRFDANGVFIGFLN